MSVCVTMFFDLKSLPDATTSVRPVDFYMKNGKTTLSLQFPMVILCDSTTRPWITELRTQLAGDVPTIYIEKRLTEYDHYILNYHIIKKNRESNTAYTNSRNTVSYCLTTTLKFTALNIASEVFPDATHYWWIDFGCAHIADRAEQFLPQILKDPNPKVSCAYIHYRSQEEISSMRHYLQHGNPCSLAATIFSVEKSYIKVLFTRAMSIFYEMLSLGVGHNEEAILIYLYNRFPDMFHIYYGDYYSTVCNYKKVCMDYSSIKTYYLKNLLNDTRNPQQRQLIRNCCERLLDDMADGTLSLPAEEIVYLHSLM